MSMRTGLAGIPLNFTTPVTAVPPVVGAGADSVRPVEARSKTTTTDKKYWPFTYPPGGIKSIRLRRLLEKRGWADLSEMRFTGACVPASHDEKNLGRSRSAFECNAPGPKSGQV